MHELSLCRAIVGTAIDHAGGRPVERVRVRIGHLRQVVPETLEYCWRVYRDTTELAGCELDVEYVPATIRCDRCGATTSLDQPVLRCGTCAGRDVALIAGDELLVVSIDVAVESSSTEDG